ncbi:MAG: SRPBCC domain-containing protein [Acidimicrobiia bacterium]|nr:SRPBCC domain-containing protein [Acidimicrobiia bacterium]MDH5420703.1 SRPBCC domain-containing protein [Acidimicrobiia bacterium]MDH5503935.1 SRPBCC domain-containing protein [Acidimicrobiia bacterium]
MTDRYHVSRKIAAPPQAVWDLLSDTSTYADWNPAVVSISGTIAEGNTVSIVSIVNPKRTFKLNVTAVEPPRRMVWSDGMPFGLFKGERTYLVEPDGAGSVFSMTELYTGPLAGLITKTIPDMTDSFDKFADGLKAAAEGA